MRIWLDPNKLYARSLTTEDVVNALDLPVRVLRAVRTRLLFVDTPPIAR